MSPAVLLGITSHVRIAAGQINFFFKPLFNPQEQIKRKKEKVNQNRFSRFKGV